MNINIIGKIKGGRVEWKELINQRKDTEAKNMVLETEWKQNQVELQLETEEEKAEKIYQHKAAY